MKASAPASVRNGGISFWLQNAGEPFPIARRPPLLGDLDADVCIVGAGYTGLWTAYYLKHAARHLRIVVLEREFAGFGASGRNGGWLSGLIPGSRNKLAAVHGRESVVRMQHEMNKTVDEVIAIAAREGIDAEIVKSGTVRIAVTTAQAERLRKITDADHAWGTSDVQLLSQAELRARIQIPAASIAAFNPHCARIQPAKLVRGLARAVESLGVTILEDSAVTVIESGQALTTAGRVRAPVLLRATEGFTPAIRGLTRTWLPLNSSLIVTRPLPERIWREIGWDQCETLGDSAHVYVYAQRTPDGRIAIGGRGVPYRFGSRTDIDGHTHARTIRALTDALHRLLPQTRDVEIEHGWCGVLAVPRDWCATVEFDSGTGLGWAGGYVGHGVASANLAGRTLADLVLGRASNLTRLAWVRHRSPAWEPEPFRWLGVIGLYRAYGWADRHEARGLEHTSPIASLADRLTGKP
jgi:glycine/D-amino acid oxidase-like deaminating enzyme